MPLYMDIHTVDSENFSVEEVVKAHMEDLAIQERFGVIQLKYWVNVPAKTLFCLMSGPNIEACNQVHVESHGNTACNIIEVSDDEYNLFLGIGTHINDLAQTNEGEIDTGYRTILLANVFDFTGNYKHYQDEIYRIIEKHEGVIVVRPDSDIMVSFIYSLQAIQCAMAIEKLLSSVPDNLEYTLAVASGRPVDEEGDLLFEETKRKLQSLSLCGHSNTLYIDKETKLLADKETKNAISWDSYSIVEEEDFSFLFELHGILKKELSNAMFKSEELNIALGLSKSQVYRKLKGLSGLAPNKLINEYRLREALEKIAQKEHTIAEIAFDHGFNSPTYFTRVFTKRFGINPTKYAKSNK